MGGIDMAGDWIKFEIATPDKAEVWLIASHLNIDPDAVVGKLLRVWIWFDQHSEKGNAASVTKMLLNREVGNADFCDAMIRCGWMIESDGQISLKDFSRHNGKSAKTRANTALRVSEHKKRTVKSNAESNATGNDSLTPTALPREEKRREDIKDTKKLREKSFPEVGSQPKTSDQNLNSDETDQKLEPLELIPTTEPAKAKKPQARFVKPTFAELKNYFHGKVERADEHERFFDYHDSKGWIVGKAPMKSWQAAANTWIRNSKEFNQQRGVTVPPFFKNQNPQNRKTRDIPISEQVTDTSWVTGPSMFDPKPAPPAETGNLIESTDFTIEDRNRPRQ